MTDRVIRAFVVVGLSLWLAGLAALLGVAWAQAHDHPLRGPHPKVGEFDPFARASAFRSERFPAGINCCHGQDCSTYHGPPPVRVERDGKWGYLFAERWFFEDARQIDPNTLAVDVRGEPVICVRESDQYPYCYHWPQNG